METLIVIGEGLAVIIASGMVLIWWLGTTGQ
jgi:hypothetical protein